MYSYYRKHVNISQIRQHLKNLNVLYTCKIKKKPQKNAINLNKITSVTKLKFIVAVLFH